MTNEPIPILSFFCGAGGFDLGFSNAGFRTLLAIDNDAAAIESFNSNSLNAVGIVADLLDIKLADIARHLAQKSPHLLPRGIIGGPPCQGFSDGNVVKNQRDPRNRLPAAYASLLAALNKKYDLDFFVFENVTGLLKRKHRDRLGKIRAGFRDAGFHIFEGEINAADFGLPQVRKRLFIVGLNATRWSCSDFIFPKGQAKARTVADALRGLPEPTFYRRGLKESDMPFHANHWTMFPKSARFTTGVFNRWRSFRRLSWDAPSPTVAYGNREIHIHPDGKRRLSILEAMLLQGFSRKYVLRGNFSQQVTQICNAVPPPVAYAIAISISKLLESHTPEEPRRRSRSKKPSALGANERETRC